jgi:rubredoxin-NAD+ reductase
MNPIVIVGSGLAGYGLLREIRKRDREVPVTVITADDGRAYTKPNLSNALAQGRTPAQLASQDAAQVAEAQNARILTFTRVTAIDPVARRVTTDKGGMAYRDLVLALGADPIAHGLTCSGAEAVLHVNDLGDYTRFRAILEGKRHVAILGGGLIGCEFANDLVATGHEASVVHLGAWPLERLVPEAMGRGLAEDLARRGVVWRFGRSATAVERTPSGLRLALDDGSELEADLVLSAIGLRSRTALAASTGLEVGRGIRVDRELRSSAAHIFAVGDCAEVAGLVLPFVMPLLAQVKALAATLTGTPTRVRYPAMPVVVKTPASPLVVSPPPIGSQGAWQVVHAEGGQRARFLDATGQMLGFALSGKLTGERVRMAQEVPPLLA